MSVITRADMIAMKQELAARIGFECARYVRQAATSRTILEIKSRCDDILKQLYWETDLVVFRNLEFEVASFRLGALDFRITFREGLTQSEFNEARAFIMLPTPLPRPDGLAN